jgi:hypothetical protein
MTLRVSCSSVNGRSGLASGSVAGSPARPTIMEILDGNRAAQMMDSMSAGA